MKTRCPSLLLAFFAFFALFAVAASAHEEAAWRPGADATGAVLDVAPAAADAVATVDRFTRALLSNDLDAAAAELDANVVILEMGGAEHSKAEYLAGHAKHDAEFLAAAQLTLRRRAAAASGDVAWVLSESTIKALLKTPDPIDATETMVLRRTAAGWKIVHIHWSSGRAKAAGT
jgi:ketosteroid isomerase-like protein